MIRRLCGLSLSLLASLALAAPASAISFDYPNFSSTAGLAVNGNASQQGNVLQLTPAEFSQVGSAFYAAPIDPQKSFETQFQVSMHDTTTLGNPADGLAFVIQSKGPNEAEGLGGGLGYAGIKPSVAVEFDTFFNPGVDPIPDHVSIMSEGDVTKHLACATEGGPESPCTAGFGFPIYGAPVYGWVEFDGATHHLKVFIAQTAEKPATPLIDHQISLAPLGSSSYAGFTAATGASTAVHDLLSWKFVQADATSTPAPVTLPGKAKGKAKKCPKGKKGKAKGHHKKAGASKAKGKKGKGKKCGRKKGKGKGKGHKH